MAIFKFKDRAKRQKSQPIHESALKTAEEAWFYSESAKPQTLMLEAYEAYRLHVEQLGGRPYTLDAFKTKFTKRMKKAGFIN